MSAHTALERRRPAAIRRATTRCSFWVALTLAGGPALAAPMTEAELIRDYLDGPVAGAELRAVEARAASQGTGPAALPNPELEARHEAARGPAGATTDAIGGAVSLDLGFSALAERAAAGLRGDAGERWQRAATVSAACELRGAALAHWSASEQSAVAGSAQARLDDLTDALGSLAEAGEVSAYTRDRAALTASAHRAAAAASLGEALRSQAQLSGLLGGAVDSVQLAPIGPLPALEDAVEGALSEHPALAALRLERDAAARSEAASRRAAAPDLRVSAGARWDAPVDGEASPGYEIGGALELPLFDWSRADVRASVADSAAIEARIARAEAAALSAVEGAWRRADALGAAGEGPLDPEAIWRAARTRYVGGEASLDELLQVAQDVESALLAHIEAERLLRAAHLDLDCAVGRFHAPGLQSVLEDRQ